MLQKFVYGSVKKTALGAYFDESLLKKPTKFQFQIFDITKMRNVADWYTDNVINTSTIKSSTFLSEST